MKRDDGIGRWLAVSFAVHITFFSMAIGLNRCDRGAEEDAIEQIGAVEFKEAKEQEPANKQGDAEGLEQKDDGKKIIEKEEAEDLEEEKNEEAGEGSSTEKYVKRDCPGKWFGGIGVYLGISPVTGKAIVTGVPRGYPASKIGIEVNDEIITNNDNDLRGEPGTEVLVTFRKPSGEIKMVTVYREKICTEE